MGIDTNEVDELLVVGQPTPEDPLGAVVVLCNSPVDAKKLPPVIMLGTTEADLDGKAYHKAKSPNVAVSVLQFDDHTLIIGADAMIKKIVASHSAPKESEMTKLLAHAAGSDLALIVLVEPMRPMLKPIVAQAPLPPPMADAKKLPDLISYVALLANVTQNRNVKLVVKANNDADAQQAEQIIGGLMAVGEQMAAAQSGAQASSSDPVDKAKAQYQKRLSEQWAAELKPRRKGPMLLTTIDLDHPAAAGGDAATTAATPVEKPKIAVDYVTPAAAAAMVAYPRHLFASPGMAVMPTELISAGGMRDFGFDPTQLDEVLAIGVPPTEGPIQYAVLLQFASAVAGDKVLPMLRARTTESTLSGKPYWKGKMPTDAGIYQVDEKTLIIGTDDLLQRMLANHAAPKEGPLSKMLSRAGGPEIVAVAMIKPVKPLIDLGFSFVPLPPPLADVKNLPKLTHYVAAMVDVSDSVRGRLTFCGNDEASAAEIETTLNGAIAFGQQMLAGQASQLEMGKDPIQQATGAYMKRVSGRLPELIKPVRKGKMVSISGSGGGPATAGFLAGLLLPAVQSAREAGRRAQSMNNMKQIVLAALNDESTTGKFSARAIFDKQGKPLLSWRVRMLPYMGYDVIYKRFHLDEPWDSPNNKALIASMPPEYRNPSSPPTGQGKTCYLAVGRHRPDVRRRSRPHSGPDHRWPVAHHHVRRSESRS